MNPDTLTAIRILTTPGQVVEIRALGDQIASGYYQNQDELARVAGILDSPEYHGVYITLNPVNPALLSRRAHRVKYRLSRTDATTADADILTRRWLPIDIDPVRPSQISASAAEHQAAHTRAAEIASFLQDLGFPDPVTADSSNGAHLLYRIDLPNDPAAHDLIHGCLKTLDLLFSDASCHVDTANANAARIWKCYGTTSRKGDSTPQRPHRRSSLLQVPDEIRPVPLVLLTRLATLYPPPPPPLSAPEKTRTGSRGTVDLAAWLATHLPGYRTKPYQGGTLYLLDTCPFSDAHSDGAYAIQFPNGAIFAGCHHDTCGGGTQRWQELRDRYEPDRKRSPVSQAKPLTPAPVRDPSRPEPAAPGRDTTLVTDKAIATDPDIDPEIAAEASLILRTRRPITYMFETFATDHEGDQDVAECLFLSLASRSVINSKGLHVSITGESGKGKSHTIDTVLRQVPPQFRLDGRMSEKALFYINGMQPGSVIALDDHALSDQMQEILKGVTSSFSRPFIYHTVSKDRTGQICTIPERCVWWIAKVEGTGDDQVFNRMLTCWIDDSEDQDMRVLAHTLRAAALPPGTPGQDRRDHQICQAIWTQLDPVFVIIPYSSRIRFASAGNRRNPDMLLDLIRSHAALMQYQRERREVDGITCIMATTEDFKAASRLFLALNSTCGSQMNKLTRQEADLLEAIRSMGRTEMTCTDLQRATGFSNSVVNKLLKGYITRGQVYSGLLEKCPAVSFLDRSTHQGGDGMTTSRRSQVYTFDSALYAGWDIGGEVWLAPEPDQNGPEDDADPPGSGVSPCCGAAANLPLERHTAEPCRSINPGDAAQNREILSYSLDSNDAAAIGGITASSGPSPHSGDPDPDPDRSAASPGQASSGGHIDDQGRYPAAASSAAIPQDTAASQVPLPDSRDFIEVEGWPQKKPCIVCGRPYTQYQERMTRQRLTEPHRPNRMLCSTCYEAARVREALCVRTIPGVVAIGSMERLAVSSGRCPVCKTGAGIWYDRERQIVLCESCYQREKRIAGTDLPSNHPPDSQPESPEQP